MPDDKPASDTPTTKQIITAIEAAIAGYASNGGQRTVSIGGVTFTYASLKDLQGMLHYFRAKEAAESPNHRRCYVIRGIMQ